jgi:hypothetical protein
MSDDNECYPMRLMIGRRDERRRGNESKPDVEVGGGGSGQGRVDGWLGIKGKRAGARKRGKKPR